MKMPHGPITQAQAIALAESRFWEGMSARDIATFQLHERRLCMPFEVFHEAIEKTLGRPVFTHEFALNIDGLKAELRGDKPAPTLEEIIALVPEEKRIVLVVDEGGGAS